MVRSLALATALVIGTTAIAGCRLVPPAALATLPTTGQGYPAPGVPTLPPLAATATPSADADGYLPPPDAPPSEVVHLADGPYADLLVPLQAAIDAGDGAWFGDRVSDDRYQLDLFDILSWDSEGVSSLGADETTALANAFLAAGDRPRVQAYFVEPGESTACLYVLTHRWQAEVPFPGDPSDPNAEPRIGPPLPPTVGLDAAALHLCRDPVTGWILDKWVYGGYHAIVERLGGIDGGTWALFVVRR